MEVKYLGAYPIKFISIEGGAKLVNPGDTFEMSEELYSTEYKDDQRYEKITKKKIKGEE